MNSTSGMIFKIKRFSVHDGPGIRTAVFLKGCPLNCIWCHSPEGIKSEISIWYNRNVCILCGKCVDSCPNDTLKLKGDNGKSIIINHGLCKLSGNCVNVCPTNAIQFTGTETTVLEVINEVEKDRLFYNKSGGGITLTGGEPLLQADFSVEILVECKRRNIHTSVETSLFCESEVIPRIQKLVDLFIIDLKVFDPALHILYTGKSNEIIKENFKYISDCGKKIIVRIPLIDNITDSDNNLNSIIDFVKNVNDKIPIEKIGYNPLAENNYKRLGIPFLLK